MRGGGGSTCGMITNWTVRAIKLESMIDYIVSIGSPPNASAAFWDAFAYIAKQYPTIVDSPVMSYTFIAAPTTVQTRAGVIRRTLWLELDHRPDRRSSGTAC
jgi:hypothetical protein